MRTTMIVAIAVMIGLAAVWGADVITASSPKAVNSVPASASLDIMQMMKDAKNLPVQQYDSH